MVDSSQHVVYEEKLNTILRNLGQQDERLNATKRRNTYIDAFQDSALKSLRQTYYNSPGQLIYPFIIDDKGVIVMHPVLPRGDISLQDTSFVQKALRLKNNDFNYTYTTGDTKWCIFKEFQEWNWLVGYAVPLKNKYADARLFRNSLVLIMAVIVIIALFFLLVIINKMIRPIKDLTKVSEAMADGDLKQEIDISGNDELGSLARSFDTMRSAIHEKINALSLAEKKLIKERNFSEAVINSLPGLFYVYEGGRQLIRWNKHFEIESGFSKDEMYHRHPMEWFDEKDRPVISKIIEKVFDEGEASVETELLFKDGPVPYFLTGTILSDEGKQYLIGVGFDISTRKKLEEELAQAQKMEAIGTLAGGIAHDFNNILSAIYGYSQLAKEDLDNPQQAGQDIEEVLEAADRAKELVKQILTFSRKTEHEKQPLQISLVVKEALKLLRSSIPTTIEIKQEISSDAVALADPTKIHQVTMNLCTNAYHAMRDKGGILSVSIKDVDFRQNGMIPQLEIKPGKYILLEVSDNGIGMDEKTKNKIFEPYFTTKEAGEGTGLGLAVIHGIINDHNGYINVYSEPEQGTSFHLYFPKIEEKAVDYSIQKRKTEIKGGDERIMIVDDEEQIINLTKKMLSSHGYKVTAFTNGVQALQEIKKQPDQYDLIITDLTMPYMTGIELTKEILAVNPRLPVILNTGLSEVLNKEKAKAAGVTEYCEKPVDLNQLLRTIRKLLDAP